MSAQTNVNSDVVKGKLDHGSTLVKLVAFDVTPTDNARRILFGGMVLAPSDESVPGADEPVMRPTVFEGDVDLSALIQLLELLNKRPVEGPQGCTLQQYIMGLGNL